MIGSGDLQEKTHEMGDSDKLLSNSPNSEKKRELLIRRRDVVGKELQGHDHDKRSVVGGKARPVTRPSPWPSSG